MDCHFQIWREDKVEQIIKSGMGTVRARAGPEARTWPEARVILGQRPISRPPSRSLRSFARDEGSRDRPLA